jgi:hypothetical protein
MSVVKYISDRIGVMYLGHMMEEADMGLEQYLTVIDDSKETLDALADQIWGCAETAYSETKSVEKLTEFFRKEGFTVKDKAYGIDTAFTASFGSGSPRIGILGEFDALSGLNQIAGLVVKNPSIRGHLDMAADITSLGLVLQLRRWQCAIILRQVIRGR